MNVQFRKSEVKCQVSGVKCSSPCGGFTILEFLIYLVIVSSASLIIGGTFLSVNEDSARIQARSEVNTSMRYAIDRIQQDIRTASAVAVPPQRSSSSTLQITVLGGQVTYSVLNGQLRRALAGNPPEPITSDKIYVKVLNFDRVENRNVPLLKATNSIKTTIIMDYNAGIRSSQYSQSAEVTTAITRPISDPARAGGLPCSQCYTQGTYYSQGTYSGESTYYSQSHYFNPQ